MKNYNKNLISIASNAFYNLVSGMLTDQIWTSIRINMIEYHSRKLVFSRVKAFP